MIVSSIFALLQNLPRRHVQGRVSQGCMTVFPDDGITLIAEKSEDGEGLADSSKSKNHQFPNH